VKMFALCLVLLSLAVWTCAKREDTVGLTIRFASFTSELTPADTFRAVLEVRNTTLNTVVLQFCEGPQERIRFYDGWGCLVLYYPQVFYQVANELGLGPLGSESYDIKLCLKNFTAGTLLAGQYRVRGSLQGYEEPYCDVLVRVR